MGPANHQAMSSGRNGSSGSVDGAGKRRGLLSRPWFRLPALAGLGWVMWCAVLYAKQDALIYPTHVIGNVQIARPIGQHEELWLEAGGLRVPAWLLMPRTVDLRPVPPGGRGPLVVWLHGNAETIDQEAMGDMADMWRLWGCAVLLPEYRGYGRAGGSPGEGVIVEDVLRMIDLAAKRPGIDGSRVILYGRSLGGGVAAQVAQRLQAQGRPPAALLLHTSFTSVASFARRYLVPSFVVTSPFRTDAVLPGLTMPVMVMHGRSDTITPVVHAERLHAMAAGRPGLAAGANVLYLTGDGHVDFPTDFEAYRKAVGAFVRGNGVLVGVDGRGEGKP
jgi:hypothetical protein